MANGKKSDIGTDKYFSGIVSRTIFDGIRPTKSNEGFTDRLKEISGNAAKALEEMYDDLEKNKMTVQFMERDQVSGLEKLADQLHEAAKFISVSVRRSASDIKSKLKSLALPSRYSMREVQQIAADLKKGVQFNKPPYKKIDDALMKAALAYSLFDKSRSNKGKNGKTLGTRDYSEQMAKSVFCDSFIRSSDFRLDKSYKEMIQKQIEGIISKIKSDVKSKQNSDEYMEHTERERVLDIANELAKHCSGNPSSGLDKELEKLRRLENFNNKVIKIDKTGFLFPVDVKLNWENGKNVLYISAKVNFSYFNPIDGFKEFINRNVADTRKQNALNSFKRWDNGGGEYKNVFGDQSVKVVVDLNETQSSFDCVRVFLDMPGDYSMGWGGVGLIDWTTYTSKLVLLSDANNPNGTATHEFGHILGLGDAYAAKYIKTPWLYWSEGVDYKQYPAAAGTVMDTGNTPTSKDIEMVINAFYTGQRQNYTKECFWHNISPILGK